MSRLALGLLAVVLIALCLGLWLGHGDGSRAGLEPAASAVPATAEAVAFPAREARVRVPEPLAPAALVRSAPPRIPTRVHGTLFDSEGAPIAAELSACVRFLDRDGRLRSSTAKEAGAYELRALDCGAYWVSVRAEGYRTLEAELELSPEHPSLRRDFTLQKAVELRIRVATTAGPGALAAIATRAPPGTRAGGPDDPLACGSFQKSAVRADSEPADCIGILQLEGDLPVYVSLVLHQAVLQTVRVESTGADVAFVLSNEELLEKLAMIRVLVVDAATRAPLANAHVALRDGPGTETDAQGNATIAGCGPGESELRVRARGYAVQRQPVDAPAGVTTDAGIVALEPEVALEGRALDAAGIPHAAALELGVLAAPGQPVEWLEGGFESRADGSFRVSGLGRRQYLIRTRLGDTSEERSWKGASLVACDARVDLRGGEVRDLELRLVPAARLVLRAERSGAASQGFRVLGEQGLEFAAGRLLGRQPRALELPPGDFRVCLLDARGAVESERVVKLGPESPGIE